MRQTSDWTLIRECLCPVLLVKNKPSGKAPRVLAAVDILAKAESYEKLNQNVIEFGKEMMGRDKADVHIVNAFQNFKGIPVRQALADSSGIESDRIHIKMGAPDKVIVETAKKIDASLVVIGNSGRSGLSAMVHGNTIEISAPTVRDDGSVDEAANKDRKIEVLTKLNPQAIFDRFWKDLDVEE